MENNFLIPFVQHGFRKAGDAGKQSYGFCPLCNHKNPKMYVNNETGQWDCKTCSSSGNIHSFIKQIAESSEKYFTPETAKELIRIKGLKYETFKRMRVGYNRAAHSYLFPLYTIDGKIHDVRIYRVGDKVISTKGCTAGLRGWENFSRSGEVWLTEGESDYYTINEVFESLRLNNEIPCSIPGAGIFKAEWMSLFSGKTINILTDNDDAGKKGAIRIYNKLSTIAGKMKFVHWGTGRKSGFDTRDFYIECGRNPKIFYDKLKTLLHPMPDGFVDEKTSSSSAEGKEKNPAAEKTQDETISKIRMSADSVYTDYKKWLHIEDEAVLDILFGTAIANRLPGDPLWVFLVAPPGGMKSELLMSLDTSPRVYTTTSLTPASLISGMNVGGNIDPSLIPRLDKKILIIKDFTTILKMPIMIRDEIFGIFRDAYDGKIEKQFGNGVLRRYNSHFGVIAGVTPAIYFHTDDNTVLGERFLMYNIKSSSTFSKRMELVERALANVTHEDKMRSDLTQIAHRVLSYDYTKAPTPIVTPEFRKRFIYLAQYASILRAAVIRDKYSKEVTHKPFIEIATRVAKQFMKLSLGIAYFRGERQVNERHCSIVKDIAIGTVPHKMEDAFSKLYKKFKSMPFTQSQAADVIGLPANTSARIVEDLRYLKVFYSKKMSSLSTVYGLTDEFKNIIEGAKLYE